ncbi:beta strand repeat-containing protein, partial [Psychrobacter proteolyticus]|uniref:beta strand repeat-containing protein n=1 Tax=Psychrobacter proteolyticus TaxID=147825 RepID=UPI00311F9191
VTGDDIINAIEAGAGFNVTGTGTAGDIITLTNEAGAQIGNPVTVDGDGNWSVAVSPAEVTAMGEGDETLTATATDAAGNLPSASSTVDIVVDTIAPTAPVINAVTGDDIINAIEAGAGFNVTGTGTAGDIITLTNEAGAQIGNPVTVDGDGNWSVAVSPAEVTAMGEGDETLTATATDAAGNLPSASSTVDIVVDTIAPTAPTDAPVVTDNVANDGSGNELTPVEPITNGGLTNDSTPGVVVPPEQVVNGTPQLVVDGSVVPSISTPNDDGSVTLTPTTALTDGDYTLSYNLIDEAGNVSEDSLVTNVTVDTTVIIAQDDSDNIDLGKLQVTTYPSVNNDSVTVLGVAESDSGTDGTLDFTVSEGANGTVSIEVSQTALVAVADAVNIEVYNSNGDRVYVGTTGGDPLVGDVIGLKLLGLTGNDTLTAVVSGLEPGDYTVVVRKSESALTTLVQDVELAELGDSGIVLGPNNQEAVLNAVETSLNTDYPILQLGTTVKGILSAALLVTNELGVDELVTLLQDNTVLNTLLGGVIDPVLDAVAVALLSNTLTLIETTDVTATLTEYDFDSSTAITGNVIDPDASITNESGEDTVTVNTKLTDISSDNTVSEPTSQLVDGINVFTIQGQYGVLVIDENGDYTYTANGDYSSSGETEVFEYTISNGAAGNSDTAKLVINISSTAPDAPVTAATITDNVANDGSGDVLTPSEVIADDGTTNDNTPSLEVAAGVLSDGETLQLVVNGNVVDAVITENADGSYTLTPQTPLDDAEYELSYNIKDAVDNVSGNAPAVTVTVDTTIPDAINDQASAGLAITPVIASTTGSETGTVSSLVSLGAVGDLVNVALLGSSTAFTVDVATNTTQDLTISGSGSQALGLSLGSDKDFDVLVYRQEVGSTQAELVQSVPNWLDYTAGIAGVIGGTWKGDALELDTFSGGAKYYIVVANGSGVLNLGVGTSVTVKTDSIITTNLNIDLVPATGNVLDNDTDTGLATIVTNINGDTISGLTTIVGNYGSLAIDTNGEYTYTPNENVNVIGQTDEFEYTIDNGNGNIDTAMLTITINGDGQATTSDSSAAAASMSASSFTLADDATSIDIPDTSLTVSSEGLDVLSFEGAGQVISLADMMQPDIIDIGGIGANTLNVAVSDVESAIYVRGDSDDTVDLEGDSWSNVAQITSENELYNVWQVGTDTSTQIYIDTDITNII